MAKPPSRTAYLQTGVAGLIGASPPSRMSNRAGQYPPVQPRNSEMTPWRELRPSNYQQPMNPQFNGQVPSIRMSNRPKKGLRNSRVSNIDTNPPPYAQNNKQGYLENFSNTSSRTDSGISYNPLRQSVSDSNIRSQSYTPLYQEHNHPQPYNGNQWAATAPTIDLQRHTQPISSVPIRRNSFVNGGAPTSGFNSRQAETSYRGSSYAVPRRNDRQ